MGMVRHQQNITGRGKNTIYRVKDIVNWEVYKDPIQKYQMKYIKQKRN